MTATLPSIGDALIAGITSTTKEWSKVKKQKIRSLGAYHRALTRLYRAAADDESVKAVAFEVMEKAYMKASANNTLPAAARQIMYAARPLILERIDEPLGKSFDKYFSQTLLVDYLKLHPSKAAAWDVVFDARGHLWEPHTRRQVQLGTLSVREYLSAPGPEKKLESVPALNRAFPTTGALNRYSNVLFIEKEGFLPLLERAQFAERYDLAIMSSKGMSSTAARTLVNYSKGVRFFVLHDFDKSGFSILATLSRSNNRYYYTIRPDVIDLGIRLSDVVSEGLEAESVVYEGKDPSQNLRANGATRDEIAFLLAAGGQRVELNAFASDHFVKWLEHKLEVQGVEKVIPADETLTKAYRRACYVQQLNAAISKADKAARAKAERAAIPKALRAQVAQALADDPALAWDDALTEIAAAKPAQRRGRKAA
jgi:hypothetical protein